MSTNTDSVAINMDSLNPADAKAPLAKSEALSTSIDGSHRSGHRRHGSGHSQGSHGSGHHHHNHYSGESDTDDHSHSRRRSRRRSRSRTPSPARRAKRNTDTAAPPTDKDIRTNTHDVEPLINNHKHRQTSHTELDEDSEENVPQHEQNPGVDDGFFTGNRANTPDGTDEREHHDSHNNNKPSNENLPFPYPPGLNPNVIMDANGNPQIIPDINVYQQKKNLAQGMMDLALLSANANQLRYVVESHPRHPYYWFSLVFISVSLVLQVAVGVGLILNSRYNVKNREQICRADKINNFTIIGIFLITTVNVFIAAFGVADAPTQ